MRHERAERILLLGQAGRPQAALRSARRDQTSVIACTRWSIARSSCQGVGVMRSRSVPFGHGRVVDRLNVDAVVVEQQVGGLLAQHRIADQHRHDVRGRGHQRQTRGGKPRLQGRRPLLVPSPQRAVGLEVAHAGQRPADHRRRQRGREDEAGRDRAHRVDQRRRARDVAAHAAERLRQRPLDHGEPRHLAMRLGDAAAARTVQPDRVHLVEIGHGAVALGEIADRRDRPEVAVHRVDRFERDQLRDLGRRRPQQRLEMRHVIVAKNPLLAAGMPDAGDHRGVVVGIGEDHAARHQLADGRERRLVGDVAGGEQQGRGLGVQIGQLALQQNMQVGRAGDVARAAGAGAHGAYRGAGRVQAHRMLAHAEIVVRAPHRDLALRRGIARVRGIVARARVVPGPALQIAEHPVASFVPDGRHCGCKTCLVVHRPPHFRSATPSHQPDIPGPLCSWRNTSPLFF